MKKRAVTLIEIMIVILLIGLIGGALAFNMRGSLDQGKVFKTEQTQTRIHDILMLEAARGDASLEEIAQNWKTIVSDSPLIKQGSDFTRDAWHRALEVKVVDDEIIVQSPGLDKYHKKHEKK